MSLKKHLIGDTIQITMVNSGVTPSAIVASVFDGDETVVDSGSMTNSGNGHYYFDHTVINTPGFYVAQTLSTINSKPYKNRIRFQAVLGETD